MDFVQGTFSISRNLIIEYFPLNESVTCTNEMMKGGHHPSISATQSALKMHYQPRKPCLQQFSK